MSKTLKTVLACVIALLPLAVNALGLGEIKLNSGLNQPLDAVIPIVGATPDEIDSLHVKVASAAQFKQAGIPMAGVLSQLQFTIVKNTDGSADIHITTSKSMNDPFVDFLADATWGNGELIREYTVFLNPPNFESTSPASPAPAAVTAQPAAASPAAQAPVAATTATAPAAKPSAPQAAAPATPVQTPAPQTATPAAAPAVSAGASPLGGNYGPIHRGETLSGIAWHMRPQGVTLNQMMIAIYRANPEVFMRNINLMKAGYVLRIPNMADIQAVSVSEANSEVRTQIASWRASRGMHTTNKPAGGAPQPSLQLVAPSSAESAGKNQLPGAGNGKNAAATAAASAATGSGAGSAAAAASTTSHAPITVKSSKLAAVQAQAGMQNKQGAEAKIIPLQPHKPAEVKPLPNKKFAVQQPAASSGGLMDLLSNTYVIIAAIAILLLLLVGIIIKKRRAANNEMPMRPVKIKKAPTADADWEKEEKAGLKDVTGRKGDAAPEATPAGDQGSTASHMTTTNLKLDESDPMTEADFHMAYGLYDQAADVLNKALQQDPNRRDLKLKLLEVYFTAGDRSNFVETARALRQEMGTTPDKDWENVAIMGRQVAPEEPLFVETGAAAAGVSVDIPLESAGTGTAVHTDLDPLAGAFEGVRPVSMPPAPEKPAAEQQMVDFSLPDIEPVPKGKKAAPAVAAAEAAGTEKKAKAAAAPVKKGTEPAVTADFGTDSQVEFDKALKELSDFVNTNVPPQDEGSRSGTGTGTVAQSLSLAADADVPAAQAGTSTGTGEETTGLNEIGTKLDLARAYIDMGDADGARNILQEVLEEGDSLQQQEARKLLQGLT